MTETTSTVVEPPRRFHFGWLFPALFRPRRIFTQVTEQTNGVWLTPLLILTLLALLRVLVAGPIQQAAAQSGQVTPPPGFEYWSPEQQTQFFQSQQLMSGPVFVYVFPALTSVLGAWLSWVVTFGLLHLVLTLLGGRGSTRTAMNVAAWASLPFAVRDLVRIVAILFTQSLITHPSLSGFAPADGGGLSLYLAALLKQIDLYLVWHIALLVLGVSVSDKLAWAKALGGVLFTMIIVILFQALPGFIGAQLGSLASGSLFF